MKFSAAMTEIHIWSSRRYNFSSLSDQLNKNSILKRKFSKINVHFRKPLNIGLFFNIFHCNNKSKNVIKLHLIVIDDLDFIFGTTDRIFVRIIWNLISSIQQSSSNSFIICSDFTSSREFSNENDDHRRIRKIKARLDNLAERHSEYFSYFDHEDLLEFPDYTDDRPLMIKLNQSVVNTLINDLEESPLEAFK